jgi:hypothetical protein
VTERGPINPDHVSFCEFLEEFAIEVGSVVGADGIWHTESINDV